MRVIEQSRLWFREGASDKVYEIDLVEVAANQYVVNFRFGRRGTALKDGTKTALPLSLDKARAVFQKLVAEKLAGGFQTGTPPAVAPPVVTTAPAPSATSAGAGGGPPSGGGPYRGGGGGGGYDPRRRKKDAIIAILRAGPGIG
ncbi:MAG: WGR domain-containing protein, partial [Kofleriaceae bacterium]